MQSGDGLHACARNSSTIAPDIRRIPASLRHLFLKFCSRSLPYNTPMSHLEIILPFAIPPAPFASDLLRELRLPALSTLVGKSTKPRPHRIDDFARYLPHELLLAGSFIPGQPDQSGQTNAPPAA